MVEMNFALPESIRDSLGSVFRFRLGAAIIKDRRGRKTTMRGIFINGSRRSWNIQASICLLVGTFMEGQNHKKQAD